MTLSLELEKLERCPLCGNGGHLRTLLWTRDFESGTGEYSIQECLECSLAFTNPRPTEQSLPALYSDRDTPDFALGNRGVVQRLRDSMLHRYLTRRLPFKQGAIEILDFGCGDGSLAHCAAQLSNAKGPSTHVTAVDFHDQAPAILSGGALGVRYLDYWQWRQERKEYDVIFLRHVLEHHPEPLRLLHELSNALKDNGAVHIEVPNRRSLWAIIFGRYYSMHYIPRHLLHFDEDSLRRTIQNAGLRVTAQSYGHSPCIPLSVGHLLAKRLENVSLLGILTFPLQFTLDASFGRSTTLRISAAK